MTVFALFAGRPAGRTRRSLSRRGHPLGGNGAFLINATQANFRLFLERKSTQPCLKPLHMAG
jgi:hypothetical protein